MLIPLMKKKPIEQADTTQEAQSVQAGAPIKANLSQKKPARKSSAKKEKIIVDPTIELRATIERIFANEDAVLITTEEELKNFLSLSDVFGLDTETTGLRFFADKIVGFSLGTATKSCYIPLTHEAGQNYQDDLDRMCDLLLTKKYYGFNAQFDWHFLEHFKPQLKNLQLAGEGSVALRCYDITLPHELKPVYKRVIDPDYEEYSFSRLFKSIKFHECDPKFVYKYAAVDARKHFVVTEYFEEKLKEVPEMYTRYRKLELRALWPLYDTEEYGMCVDVDRINMLWQRLEDQKAPALAEIQRIAGSDTFNPGSPKQVKEVFAALGYQLTSTNEEALEKINHPLAKAILEYRGIIKLQGTYTKNLLEYTDVREGSTIIHTSFNSIGADTGRMSSKNPNMQNIPRDNDYRNIFVARPGKKLISVDYSQQEVRVVAAMANDQTMLDAFNSGRDFYAYMASLVFKLPYEECGKHGVNGAKRNQMKSVVLGLNYSMGIQSLADDLGTTETEAKDIMEKFYEACPNVHAFQAQCLDFAKTHGYNETYFGHRRYYKGLGYKALGLPRFEVFGPGLENGPRTPDEIQETLYQLKNRRKELRAFIEELKAPAKKKDTAHLAVYVNDREMLAFQEERQTTNSVIQGTSAEMTKLAAIAVRDDEELRSLDAHIVNFIHDEIIIEAPEETASRAGERLAFIMNDVCHSMFPAIASGGAVADEMTRWTKD